jgi:arginine exporter protein ArgO
VNLKPEMTLDKLQLLATVVVSSNFKVRWFTWWTSGIHTRSPLYFPATPFSDKDFESWLNRAVFWAGISAFVGYIVLSSQLQLSVYNLCIDV